MFVDLMKLASSESSAHRSSLISSLLQLNLLESIQNMWTQRLTKQLLHSSQVLPQYLDDSLAVRCTSLSLFLFLCVCVSLLNEFVKRRDLTSDVCRVRVSAHVVTAK